MIWTSFDMAPPNLKTGSGLKSGNAGDDSSVAILYGINRIGSNFFFNISYFLYHKKEIISSSQGDYGEFCFDRMAVTLQQ
jgi:hypothetical protein